MLIAEARKLLPQQHNPDRCIALPVETSTEQSLAWFESIVDRVPPHVLAEMINTLSHRLQEVPLASLDNYTVNALRDIAERTQDHLNPEETSRPIIFSESTTIGLGNEVLKLQRRHSKLTYTYAGITVDTDMFPSAIKMFEYILRQPEQIGMKDEIAAEITDSVDKTIAKESGNLVEVAANRIRKALKTCLEVYAEHNKIPLFFPWLFTLTGTGYQFGYIESQKILMGKIPRNASPSNQVLLYISSSV